MEMYDKVNPEMYYAPSALRLAKCWQSGKTFGCEAQSVLSAQNWPVFLMDAHILMSISNL